jgi:MFS transporter, DHA1 family, tetracycline resistance protein
VSEREQGELQGAIGSLRSITFIIGPVLFSSVFGFFIDPKHSFQIPGAPFYLAAALLLTAMMMSFRLEQAPAVVAPSSPNESTDAIAAASDLPTAPTTER